MAEPARAAHLLRLRVGPIEPWHGGAFPRHDDPRRCPRRGPFLPRRPLVRTTLRRGASHKPRKKAGHRTISPFLSRQKAAPERAELYDPLAGRSIHGTMDFSLTFDRDAMGLIFRLVPGKR
jgi:hypothetical protein